MDIDQYRKWMVENKAIAEAEAAYLHKDNDLLNLNQGKADTIARPITPFQPTALMMVITSATALPIVLFRIVPGFTSRLTIILLLVPSVTIVQKGQAATGSLFSWTECRNFLFVYFGVLTLAALVI
jgi:hypothetical protein